MLPRARKGRGATLNPKGASSARSASRSTTAGARSPRRGRGPRRRRPRCFRTGAHDHRPQRFARHPVRPVDQPLPRLRARLRLLLRAAEPRHLGLSPGLDFETKIFVKPDAAPLLRQELARPGYVCQPIALGANTDPYQPLERRLRITRAILEVLAECAPPGRDRHQVGRW